MSSAKPLREFEPMDWVSIDYGEVFDKRRPFAPGGHPQSRERGEGDQPPRRKHPQVEKKEDTVGRVAMINGAMSSTLIG
jgi:hypothetical protein